MLPKRKMRCGEKKKERKRFFFWYSENKKGKGEKKRNLAKFEKEIK